MKKLSLCLAVLLLLLAGCSAAPTAALDAADATLPTLENAELSTQSSIVPPQAESIVLPQESETGSRPTFNRIDAPESHGSAAQATVSVAEVIGRDRRRPDTGDAQIYAISADAVSFGETNPLVFSSVANDDETVTVSFTGGNCYVQNGKLLNKVDSVSLSFGDTVYVEVRNGDSSTFYALWLNDNN